jgi:hypothetical protein
MDITSDVVNTKQKWEISNNTWENLGFFKQDLVFFRGRVHHLETDRPLVLHCYTYVLNTLLNLKCA